MTRGHKCDYRKQVSEVKLDGAVVEVLRKLVSNKKFAGMMREKINMEVDTTALDQEISAHKMILWQCYLNKDAILPDLDNLDYEDKHYKRRKTDLENRLSKTYDKIEETENLLVEAKAKKRSILAEKIYTGTRGSSKNRIMKTREEALRYGLSFSDTYQDAPFHDQNWQLVRYGGNKKAFLWTYERDGQINLNVKADPEKAFFWRKIYQSVIPGYHQNKDHWNTIILDGSIPDKDIRLMIAESYDLISDCPSKRIYEAVKKIPYGHVATYAQVAEIAGDRKMARAVGNALHKNPDPEKIPCFRVVNSKGELAGEFAFGGPGAQAERLEAEGITVSDGKVDLSLFQWKY